MSAGTPGPWKVSSGGLDIEGVGVNRRLVAMVPKDHETPSKDYDDARLIAAAPDLLAALEALDQLHHVQDRDPFEDEWDDAFAKATSAIAKARGAP